MLIVPQPQVAQVAQPAQLEVIDDDDVFGMSSSPSPVAATPRPRTQNQIRKNSKNQKPKRNTSWVALAVIAGILILAFAGGLTWFFMTEKAEMAGGGITFNDGSGRGLNTFNNSAPRSKRQPAKPVVPEANAYDKGTKNLKEVSSQGSNADLSMSELIKKVEPSIVRLKVESIDGEGVGSGFFIDTEGKIITNMHVIDGATSIQVESADGKKCEALGYIVSDRSKDLAIIQIEPDKMDMVPIAIADDFPEKGEKVVAFGAPLGFSFSQTEGIVSAIRSGLEIKQTLEELSRMGDRTYGNDLKLDWIQHTAAISGGNSGGPLVNMRGELVGVNSWTHPSGQNLNFASVMKAVEKVFSTRESTLKQFARPMTYKPNVGEFEY
ncbi:MAG: trypsin-like peptidase domain-containing protein [Planctomycetota bacterium]